MTIKNAIPNNEKSFNTQVYELICRRLKLKRREKIIFFKFLGFLIRNDKPFPCSIKSLCKNTGYSRAAVFEAIHLLEKYRLIVRIGYTNTVKYKKGTIMVKACSLVQICIKNKLYKNCELVQILDELPPTSPVSGYKKTSSSLKHKEKGRVSFATATPEQKIAYHEYVMRIKQDIALKLLPSHTKVLSPDEWMLHYV